MKVGLVLSLLLHAAALSLVPSHEPGADAVPSAQKAADSCRCDYDMTITEAPAPHALTLGTVPANRFAH